MQKLFQLESFILNVFVWMCIANESQDLVFVDWSNDAFGFLFCFKVLVVEQSLIFVRCHTSLSLNVTKMLESPTINLNDF